MIIITIEEAAKELAIALKHTNEYLNLQAAQAMIKLDPIAQQIQSDMGEAQRRIEEGHAAGLPVEDYVRLFYKAQHEAAANLTLSNVFAAQDEFSKILTEANTILNNELIDEKDALCL